MATEIKASANKFKRTFTIRKYENGKVVAKYRTMQFSRDKFEELEYNLEGDWFSFLRNNEVITLK